MHTHIYTHIYIYIYVYVYIYIYIYAYMSVDKWSIAKSNAIRHCVRMPPLLVDGLTACVLLLRWILRSSSCSPAGPLSPEGVGVDAREP